MIDFEHLKEAVGEVARRFHYGDITTHPHFAGQSPSAEAVARYFFDEVRKALGEEGERAAAGARLGGPRLQRDLLGVRAVPRREAT